MLEHHDSFHMAKFVCYHSNSGKMFCGNQDSEYGGHKVGNKALQKAAIKREYIVLSSHY